MWRVEGAWKETDKMHGQFVQKIWPPTCSANNFAKKLYKNQEETAEEERQ